MWVVYALFVAFIDFVTALWFTINVLAKGSTIPASGPIDGRRVFVSIVLFCFINVIVAIRMFYVEWIELPAQRNLVKIHRSNK